MKEEILDTHKISLMQFGIFFICFFIMMLDGFDVIIIAFTANSIAQDWAVSPEQLGLVFSSGLVGMTFGAMFMAPTADLYGRQFVISVALLVTGFATMAVFYIDSVTALIILRFIAGLCLGTLIAVLPALGGEFSPANHRNFILALIVSGTGVGSMVGGLISAWIIPSFGWRILYLYAGIITALMGILFYLVVPESISFLIGRKKPDTLEKVNRVLAYIRQKPLLQLPDTSKDKVESASVKSLLVAERRATTFLIWGAFAMGFAALYFLLNWLPKLLIDSGIPEKQSIHAVVMLTFGALIGSALIGWLSKRWSLSKLIALAFVIATVLTLALSMTLRIEEKSMVVIWTVWGISVLLGITLNGGFINLYTVALTIYPPQIRMTGIGWCFGLGRAGAIISPALAGLLLGMGMSAANVLALFAIAVIAAALLVFPIRMQEMS